MNDKSKRLAELSAQMDEAWWANDREAFRTAYKEWCALMGIEQKVNKTDDNEEG